MVAEQTQESVERWWPPGDGVAVAEKIAVVRRRPFGLAHSPMAEMAEKQLEQAGVSQALWPVEHRRAPKTSSKQQLGAEGAIIWGMQPFSPEPSLLVPSSPEIDVAWTETRG